MADNVVVGGATYRTDQLPGGEHVQYVGINIGGIDAFLPLTGDATFGLPIDIKRAVSLAVTGPMTDAQFAARLPLSIINTPVTTATQTSVAGNATSTQLVASNTSRRGLYIYNDSTANLRIKYGTTASVTSFLVLIPPGGYWEMPMPVYNGIVHGIWEAANGNARITEI